MTNQEILLKEENKTRLLDLIDREFKKFHDHQNMDFWSSRSMFFDLIKKFGIHHYGIELTHGALVLVEVLKVFENHPNCTIIHSIADGIDVEEYPENCSLYAIEKEMAEKILVLGCFPLG